MVTPTSEADSLFPWVPSLRRRLQLIGLKPISGPDLLIASDYSGTNTTSSFFVISMLFFDVSQSVKWHRERERVREQYLSDGRRMSFKNMNDSRRRGALGPTLEAADQLRGVLFTFAIDKRIPHFGTFKGFAEGLIDRKMLRARWKLKPLERMCIITHLLAVLLSVLAEEDQSLYWISDKDDCFSSRLHCEDTSGMLGRFSQIHLTKKMGYLALGTTALDEGDRLEEDLTAIPDLAAGAVAEVMTGMKGIHGKIPQTAVPMDFTIFPKTAIIWDWLFAEQGRLRKVVSYVQPYGVSSQIQLSVMTNDAELWKSEGH